MVVPLSQSFPIMKAAISSSLATPGLRGASLRGARAHTQESALGPRYSRTIWEVGCAVCAHFVGTGPADLCWIPAGGSRRRSRGNLLTEKLRVFSFTPEFQSDAEVKCPGQLVTEAVGATPGTWVFRVFSLFLFLWMSTRVLVSGYLSTLA